MDSKQYLRRLYEGLGDIKNDFRNYNLYNLVRLKSKGPRVLDIGCGSGYFLCLMAGQGKSVAGLEPNQDLLKLAQRPENIVHGRAEDLENLFFSKFDDICMLDTLEHLEDDRLIINKVFNLLEPNGRFVLVVPAHPYLYGKRDENCGHFRRYSKNDLTEKLKAAGFKIKEIKYWNMLGLPIYWFYERMLNKELNTSLRKKQKNKNFLGKFLSSALNFYFRIIENKMNLGFGLSIICVAEK